MGHSSRTRGSRVIESEHPVTHRPIREVSEDDVLAYVLKELEPLVEK
jgi:hypothetical protein